MKEYEKYNAIELASDESFLKWVKYPGVFAETDGFWKMWLERNPEKRKEVEEARQLILSVIEEHQYIPSDDKQREVFMRLQKSIESITVVNPTKEKNISKVSYFKISSSRGVKLTATLVCLAVAFFLGWWFKERDLTNGVLGNDKGELEIVINNSTSTKSIVLGDGSSIILKPNSTLQYPIVFNADHREVKLSGEAFFEIAKDQKRPFLVYADKIITKVLGTSFTIRAFENEKNVSVKVSTGKVSVFTESDVKANQNKKNAQLEGIILVPNQQVIFSRAESKIVKSLVDNPAILGSTSSIGFVFHDTPLKTVFEQLEKAYGVDIVFDQDVMANCFLNASLEEMPLFDKMRLICKGINAHYEVIDTHIVVTGKGCY